MDTDLALIAPYGKDLSGKAHPPNPTQQKVLDWVDKVRQGINPKTNQPFVKANKALNTKGDGIPVLYLQGGVGSGKTRAIVAPLTEMLLEIPNLRVLWGRQDFNDLKLSAMETFFEVMPSELIVDKNETYHWYDIGQNDNKKSRIYFNGLKDLTGLGSQEYGLIVVTEVHETEEKAYRTLKQRARQANMPTMILMEGNPPNKDHWLANLTNPAHRDYDKDIEIWEVSTYENWDNLPSRYTSSLESMPLSWKHKYLFGHFGFSPDGTPFYQGFMEGLHKRTLSYTKHKLLIRSWDYGYHHPACSIHQIDAKGRWLVLKEILGTEVTIDRFGEFVKSICQELYPNMEWQDCGDPAGTQKSDKNELTSVEILASRGIFVSSKPSTYRERKEIIERKMATLIDGLPSVLVDSGCTIIVDGFLGGYHYPIRKQNQAFNPSLFEQPFKDGYYEHLMNTVEYFAVNYFTGAETKEDNSPVEYRTIGPMKDVKFLDVEEHDRNYAAYKARTQGVPA